MGKSKLKQVKWKCPHCDTGHEWEWTNEDIGGPGKEIAMVCYLCNKETRCIGDGKGNFTPSIKSDGAKFELDKSDADVYHGDMDPEEQCEHFANEVDAVILRFRMEYDLPYAAIIGVLHHIVHCLHNEIIDTQTERAIADAIDECGNDDGDDDEPWAGV